VHQGIAVYGNKARTDQHAYVQQLRDGLDNFFVTFIEVLRDRAAGRRLRGRARGDRGRLPLGFLEGTRKALWEAGRESMTLTIDEVTRARVGMLIALYERAVGLYASAGGRQRVPPARRGGGQEGGGRGARAAGRVLAALRATYRVVK
jgi:glucose-6-phosphate isomerase